ncbi:MAG: hypothetical protein GX587_04975 [Bacteroidales bacterium]|nr:hypothetical protein [Bacteroidales bacterium]
MSTISKIKFKEYIESFNFTNLFNDLGWNHLNEQTPIKLNEETYTFHSVAEKSGFRIMVFNPNASQDLPDYATRLQLDRKIGKLFREHLLIFCDKNNTTQIWQLFVKQLGKPSRLSETRWLKGQEPELLYQKTSNLFFTLDEEENITIADVVDVINENFSKNVEQVTKKFYENFRKEHKKFLEFIQGISEITNREWYASLMLNRLMFCYFIQKKGFLDNNLNYLKEKLTYCQQKKGKNKFYVSFYKNFLLALFHQGLGSPDQPEEIKKEIGRIPYLNGGLFDVHELEKQHTTINISDEAFENIFHFFDQYNWHLDTRIAASGKDINPDVIGFIFEKYINDRAQMGAYYTKEDITDYISKNCIIPFLFDETERRYPKAFKSSGTLSEVEVWQMLKESGDTYIYEAIKKGVDLPLPKEIEIGMDTSKPNLIERRKEWNKSAPSEYALPTEIWREVVDRRKRYTEIKEKIEKGEITHINDFITYNLNIRQFTQDIIDSHSDPDFVRHFYEALSNITIIDPTCGSGAFLFAAMNILEPLYESCIQRMENFVEEAPKGKYAKFEEILKYVKAPEHPNLKYFVFKNIILRNLYGVDIMKEAVEIAKLRLFLKLVATVEADYKKPNLGLEPLPDIDFNIRSGNTLIGYATKKEIDDLQGMFVTPKMKEEILEECDLVSRAFQRFKEIQLKGYENKKEFTKAKTELNARLDKLADNLNKTLHKQNYEGSDYSKWLETHQPFHWFAEFYEIINDKDGFDVVIGNPPYVVYVASSATYRLTDYKTISCSNLYAYCIERSFKIMNTKGKFSMIVPNSSISADKLSPLQKLITNNKLTWISNYSWRPSKLFEGADMLLAIIISTSAVKSKINSSMYHKWYNEFRDYLFDNIKYHNTTNHFIEGTIPKFSSYLFTSILEKQKRISKSKTLQSTFLSNATSQRFFYFRAVQYWFKILEKEPVFLEDGEQTRTGEMKPIYSDTQENKYILITVLSSTTFFLHYITWSSCQVVNSRDFDFLFDINSLNKTNRNRLVELGKKLQKDYQKNSHTITRNYSKKGRSFTMEKQHFYIKKSKDIIDEIDTVLAEHYGFTEEELDFIINYDIKYRMGKELENGEEEE